MYVSPACLSSQSHEAGSSEELVGSVESSYTAEAFSVPWTSVGLLLCDVVTVLMCLAAVHGWVCRW